MDKIRFVEAHAPHTLIMGNSRTDNGFDPATVQRNWPGAAPGSVFNFGLPGADASNLYGIVTRFAKKGLLGPGGITEVVIGLDESLLQENPSLGYSVFYNDRDTMVAEREFADLLGSILRLWGFSENFKELREPAKLQQFVFASLHGVEPLGGPASKFLGYRAGFGAQQDAAQLDAQEAGAKQPPSARLVRYLTRTLELLKEHGVKVAVVFPPLRNRRLLFSVQEDGAAIPFLRIRADLERRGVAMIDLAEILPPDPGGFINAGHLNDKGAQRYSALLGRTLAALWPGR